MNTKICGFCKKDLPETLEFFAIKNKKNRVIFQWQCRECQKTYRKDHYEKNKEKYIKKARSYNKKVADWFQDIKTSLKCSACSEDRWWVLDFHHRDPSKKEYSLARLRYMGSKTKLTKELSKCDVLCSNCHRDLHYQEKQAVVV